MSDKCFGIYTVKNASDTLIVDLSKFYFFIRNKLREFMMASAREIIDRSKNDSIIDIELNFKQIFYVVGIKTTTGSVLIFTNETMQHGHLIILARYILAKGLCKTISENFDLIKTEAKIQKIQQELSEITYVMIDNIDALLAREEKLDDLVNRTAHLSEESKSFYHKTKNMNRCCLII